MQPYSGPPWQPSAPPAPPAPRRGLTGVLIAGSVVVVLLIGAIVVLVIVRSGRHQAGGPTPGPTGGGAGNAGVDSCLIGTWKAASEHMRLDLPQVGAIALIGQGLVSHVHADGSVDDDYGQTTPYTGSSAGHAVTMKVSGTAHSRIATSGGTMSFHDVTATGTVTYSVDGTPTGSTVALSLSTDPVQYTCLNRNASQHTDRYDATLTKISDAP